MSWQACFQISQLTFDFGDTLCNWVVDRLAHAVASFVAGF